MIAFIKGTVHSFTADKLIVENNGIGYEVYFTHQDQIRLNQDVMIYTYQNYSEYETSLYGFLSFEEQELFEKLISVKGIGPKTGMGILAATTVPQLVSFIEQGDVTALKKMPGIGAKAASQIILDLKGKLVTPDDAPKEEALSQNLKDAQEALKSLGYKNNEIASVIKQLKKEEGLSTDEYIKRAFQLLLKQKGV